ncbi:MAG: ATP-binding cassette domain-containing protein [Candidatus Peribacteraceae bacterium]|nr:ATP-binding cassette domain-containing protein [Candidatus Peribacteraceae bacterium]
MIVLKSVSKDFGRGNVLDGISLTIDPKECVCILGSGAAGKSTLLSLLIGAEHPTSGSITIDGADLRTIPRPALQLFRRKVGIVFQDAKLLSTRTVAENIAFPMETNGDSDEKIEKRVRELLRRMNLVECANALPHQLSAGEIARTAVARAVAHAPLIVIADEPLRNLDLADAENTLRLFHELSAAGTTLIVMTRDASLAEALRARVIRLERGKIVAEGKRETRRDEMVQTPGELVKTHIEAIEKRRKVRVTAIHSE